MTQRKRRWFWTTVGAVALLTPTPGPEAAPSIESGFGSSQDANAAGVWRVSDSRKGGEGGERGEGGEKGEAGGAGGGEGGERGVDPARAARDPVPFLIALDVIRAHYLAGRDAFVGGRHESAMEMFLHPISEVYVDLEDVFKKQGVKPFEAEMTKAGEVAGNKDAKSVQQSVTAVLAALDAAGTKAPPPGGGDTRVNALVIAEMVDRAAAQYQQAAGESEGEAYLDGYGFYKAAAERSGRHLTAIGKRNADTAKAIELSLALLARAYPSAIRPATTGVKPGDVLAVSSRVALSVGSLK